MKNIHSLLLALIFVIGLAPFAHAQENQTHKVQIKQWLSAGPVEVQLPAFHHKNNLKGQPFTEADLLKFQQKAVRCMKAGETFFMQDGKTYSWKEGDGAVAAPSDGYFVNWQGFYVETNQYLPLKISVTTAQAFELFVDGKKELTVYKSSKEPVTKEAALKLNPGKYLVVIKSLYNNKDKSDWKVSAALQYDQKFGKDAAVASLTSRKPIDLAHILLGKMLRGTSLSSDGKYIMLNYSEAYPPDGKTNRWIEIKNLNTKQVIYSSEHAKISQVEWVPDSHKISYVATDGVDRALFTYDLDSHKEKVLMNKLERFAGYEWSHDASYLVFSVTEQKGDKKKSVYEMRGMQDRWPWYRTRTQLYLLKMDDLSVKPLTYGYLTNNLQDISPNDQNLLISQSFPYYTERPYTKQVMMQLNIQTLKVDTLWVASFGGQASYSPDGKQLVVTGSPDMFNGLGIHLKKKGIPNDYDTQAYIFDIKSKTATAISKDFNPSIGEAYWNPLDNDIYFLVQDGTYNNIWKYNVASKKYAKLPSKVDVINQMDFAANSPVISYSGSSVSYPATGWVFDTKTQQSEEVANPEKKFFSNVQFGKVEDWNFKNKQGHIIEGRVYYPPNYDPNKKYPLIVNYYGGTVPVERSFGGRYPLNLFAAQGYVVYLLQPSGAIGYGQDFSALHVNGWGKENAQDIIDGTKQFLKAHPSVNPDEVGCIGASYGGYMTMYLQTQTHIFKTAIAHAGISDITSYWGEGYWGYLYSSVASANSFPWNNRKLYVDKSPLFLANKITTPMLLIQGTSDTNVPPGESIQLYTALKLQGKPVTMVWVKDQDHHIVDYKKRILWQHTLFAWFDKYLKDQPAWWDSMYPKKDL
ncbi:MAG: S9 family peptidase [Bacteroidales bacterium]|nr:S9 family peptidase [Bacteroidales bacterium]